MSAATIHAQPDTASDRAPDNHRLGVMRALFIVLFGSSLLLLRLGDARVLSYHEVLFAQPAREMAAGQSTWILPRFCGKPCTHKPPGNNWLIAASLAAAGESEFVVRFHSVVAAIATALLVAAMGARWFGQRVGLISGLLQLTTFYTLWIGRIADADMSLIASVTAAMTCFVYGNVDSPRGIAQRGWLPVLFHACVAASFLVKAMIGPAMIYGAVGLYALIARRRSVWKFVLHPLGVSIFLLTVLSWYAAAAAEHPKLLADQFTHHIGRFEGQMGGGKKPFYYLYSIPLVSLPWTPLTIVGIVWAWRRGRFDHPWARVVLCWTLPGVVLLTMSTFKEKHYAAPLLPPLTIVAAWGSLVLLRQCRRLTRRIQLGIVGAVATGAAVATAVASAIRPDEFAVVVALSGVVVAATCAMAWFGWRRQTTGQLATLLGTAWLVVGTLIVSIQPKYDSFRDAADLALQAHDLVPAKAKLLLLDLPEHPCAWYLPSELVRVDHPQDLLTAWPARGDEVYCITPTKTLGTLRRLGRVDVLAAVDQYERGKDEDKRLSLARLDLNADAWQRVSQLRASGQSRAAADQPLANR